MAINSVPMLSNNLLCMNVAAHQNKNAHDRKQIGKISVQFNFIGQSVSL